MMKRERGVSKCRANGLIPYRQYFAVMMMEFDCGLLQLSLFSAIQDQPNQTFIEVDNSSNSILFNNSAKLNSL